MSFKIDLFEQINKDIIHNSDALRITNILLRYNRTNRDEIFEELYFFLRNQFGDGGWGPEHAAGLPNYWLDMMDAQVVKWY